MLTRWDPFQEMMTLRNAVDRLFDASITTGDANTRPLAWGMPLDVIEEGDAYIVKANIPGINPDDIEITFTGNVLTIKGEMQREDEIKENRYHMRERRYGSFSRSISLGDRINGDNISAAYDNGVLSLTLPKAEEAKPKRISVKPNGKVIEAENK
jgi:HSP20 family protein